MITRSTLVLRWSTAVGCQNRASSQQDAAIAAIARQATSATRLPDVAIVWLSPPSVELGPANNVGMMATLGPRVCVPTQCRNGNKHIASQEELAGNRSFDRSSREGRSVVLTRAWAAMTTS